ncbi:MAG: DUF423 domain-containing protein [Bacteroidota bacterium]|nr:DUF423 domain-containing protein [Bacteroidota bacterium]
MTDLSKIIIACFVLCVALGAFSSHFAEFILTKKQLKTFQIGTNYLLYNVLILLPLSLSEKVNLKKYKSFLFLLMVSIFLFSGSLWLLAFQTHLPILSGVPFGIFTPIGGLLMMFSYLFLILQKDPEKKN